MDINIGFESLKLTHKIVYQGMGYRQDIPDSITQDITETLIVEAFIRVKPKCYFQIFEGDVINDKAQIKIGDTIFDTGATISKLMYSSTHFTLFTATAGAEFQEWIEEVAQENDALKQFILDAIGSCIAECAGDYMETLLEKEIGTLKHTNRFSPGYCGWHVKEQQKLFAILPANVCDITLNDSSLMTPIKSISGIIGIGDNVNTKLYGCAVCEMTTCYNRRSKTKL